MNRKVLGVGIVGLLVVILGAGAFIHTRGHTKGMTTAATILASGANRWIRECP